MRISRRGFFQAVGATAGAAALAGQGLAKADVAGADLERWTTPEERAVPSVCQQCPGGCGLIARTLDGDLAHISGNPLHPINRGALCPKAYGGLQLVYDPDRLRGPMARDGARGRLRPISWDDALRLLTQRLGELRRKGLSHTVAILGGQYRGYRDTLWKRFAEAYGTPNYIRVRCLAPERPALAHQLMQGLSNPIGWDLAHARCILSFGVGLLEAWLGPVHASQMIAGPGDSGERQRPRLIHVDPRRSHTGVKADRWVPIIPGTDGVLALGIANALVREGLFDREFVEQHTFGFDAWVDRDGRRHEGFRDLVLGEYGLLTVSAATGVPVKTILEIARDLATLRPAIVIGERGSAYGPDDLHTRMAIHALNGLIGSVGTRGGLSVQGELPLAPLPAVRVDEAARQALGRPRIDGAGHGRYLLAAAAPQMLPEAIIAGAPYPINAVVAFATNPLGSHPAREAFAQAFERVPFVVSFSPFLDETSSRADLILPDATYLERWQDDQVTHLAGFTCFSVAQPAMAPRHDTRDTADVLLQVAKSLGGPVAESLPWASFDKLIHAGARGLYEARRGYVVSSSPEESLRKVLERQGYWAPEFKSYDEFWSNLVKRGAWWDPTELALNPKALLNTGSGRFEFYATALQRAVETAKGDAQAALLVALGGRDRGDRLYLPFVPIAAPQERNDYPLRLTSYRLVTRPIGGGRNQPWLLEQPAVHVRASWERWVEIHPDAAAKLAITDGDLVWVESPRGRIRLRAKLYAGSRPDVVSIPLFGGTGANQNDIIVNEPDPFRGFAVLNTTRVRVYKG